MATKKSRTAKKKATKKVAKKKAVATKKSAAKKSGVDPKVLAAAKKALPKIASGEVTLRQVWMHELKLDSIVPLRNACVQILGSKEKYLAMLDKRSASTAKGSKKGSGSSRGKVGSGSPIPRVSDKGVPVVTSSKYSAGWSGTTLEVRGVQKDVVISPDGTHYIRAGANERADLICDHAKGGYPDLGKSRWRRLETSGLAKKAKKQEKLVQHGEKARAVKKTAKKGVRRKVPGGGRKK